MFLMSSNVKLFVITSDIHLNLIPSHIPTKNIEELLKENRLHLFYNKSSNAQLQECFSMETEVLAQIDEYLSKFQKVR